ncbi:hypothetical protein [Streptomyces sp. NPDC005533]|uniref:hypothetical protein n=1 Tax=Streptomyces sp. NPDC005533 TaxID=3364723 RepID=UPI00367F81C5
MMADDWTPTTATFTGEMAKGWIGEVRNLFDRVASTPLSGGSGGAVQPALRNPAEAEW